MENEVNRYVVELIRNTRILKHEYHKFYENDYEFPLLIGKLESSTVMLLLKKALNNRKLRDMTHSLLYFCDANTVSLDLLNLIDRFPRRTRYSYYSSLAHCDLTFIQFWCINERAGTEAFENLFHIICENIIFSENDMRMLLENANYTKALLKICIEDTQSCSECISKIEIAQKYL